MKVNWKKKQLLRQIFFEVIKLENEIVISKIVFEMVHGQSYKGFQKNSHIPAPIARH